MTSLYLGRESREGCGMVARRERASWRWLSTAERGCWAVGRNGDRSVHFNGCAHAIDMCTHTFVHVH